MHFTSKIWLYFAGLTGLHCDVNIDDCQSHPCPNGATCIDGINKFSCQCPTGFTGSMCQLLQSPCQPNPCMNGGICGYVSGQRSFLCTCPRGVTGPTCEKNVDDCENHNCENGATCVDQVRLFIGLKTEHSVYNWSYPLCHDTKYSLRKPKNLMCNWQNAQHRSFILSEFLLLLCMIACLDPKLAQCLLIIEFAYRLYCRIDLRETSFNFILLICITKEKHSVDTLIIPRSCLCQFKVDNVR